jgi:hypothetical protein
MAQTVGRRLRRSARWLAWTALVALALGLPGSEPRSQTPEPAVQRNADPAASPKPSPGAARPGKPGSRSNQDRFNPSEEVAPDNDVPFPVDI